MQPKVMMSAMALMATGVCAEPKFGIVEMPEHTYSGGWEHFVGGGLAVFDCDGDGLPELFAAGGAGEASLMRNRSEPGGTLRFELDTPPALRLTSVTGAYPLDIDSDGLLDLAVLRAGENLLMRGGAECSFSPFEGLGFTSPENWTTAFSATWEAEESLPTLAFGNYVDRSDPNGPFEACDDSALYRPEGDRYGAPMVLAPSYCPLSILFSDWGRTGRADLRMSNDRHYYVNDGHEQMWAMEATPRLYAEADGWQNHKLWGMGIAQRDLDGDGLAEVYLTSMGDQKLQRLDLDAGGPTYTDVSYHMGTTAHRPYVGGDGRPSTGWHVDFGDVQNDGQDDIFVTKGNVDQMPGLANNDPNNLLVQQPDGSFAEAGDSAGIVSFHRGRGGAMADLNGDGLLDLAVLNRRAPLEVWQNVTPDAGHWLAVDLHQQGANSRAVGGWIEVKAGERVYTREITVGGGHAGGRAVPEHFGLGDAATVALRVTWPDGTQSAWMDMTADQVIRVERQ